MATSDADQLPALQTGSGRRRGGKTDYMYRPPMIRPNYGKVNESLLPKTNMSRVLLFENNMVENILNVKLKFIAKDRKTYRFAFRKNRYAFIDSQNHRWKWHELWENGYKKITDSYIEKYGRLYTPVPEPEPEPPFSIHARIAPPINVLCFYLDSQQNSPQSEKPRIRPPRPMGRHKPSVAEYLLDHERLIGSMRREDTDIRIPYARSVEDPRFRNLAETLQPPGFETMGYIQLSPTFHNAHMLPKTRSQPRRRELTLPDFYTRRHVTSPDSESPRSFSRKHSIQKDSTFPYVEDRRSSFSEISIHAGSEAEQKME